MPNPQKVNQARLYVKLEIAQKPLIFQYFQPKKSNQSKIKNKET